MEDEYCCSCGEIIWNPLPLERLLAQIGGYVRKSYSSFVFRRWSILVQKVLLEKYEQFDDVIICPHCAVMVSKVLLGKITKKVDWNLERGLVAFEEI